MKEICVLKNVSKSYARFRAIKNISIHITQGQKILLTGENGAGKSTLIKLLASLIKPDTGQISFYLTGLPLSPQEFRSKIGYLASESMLHPELSILENLSLIFEILNFSPSESIANHLKFWNLSHVAHKPTKTLSRGELQKANIIRSIIHSPPFLLWDEPQNGLDQKSQYKLSEYLESTIAATQTIVCASHLPQSIQSHFQTNWNLDLGVIQT